MQFFQAQLESPLGALSLVTDDRQQVRALEFADSPQRLQRLLHLHYGTYTLREAPAPAAIVTALAHYFGAVRRAGRHCHRHRRQRAAAAGLAGAAPDSGRRGHQLRRAGAATGA